MDLFRVEEFVIRLKQLNRKGWELRGIKNPESVADHSYSAAIICMVMSEKIGIDSSKCIKLALIHDLQESIAADITPHDNIPAKEKSKLEEKAIIEISEKTGAVFFHELWKEYEENKTPESKLVHDADKLEMLFQALSYEKEYPEKDLSEFFAYVKGKLQMEESIGIYEQMLLKRKNNLD